MLGNKKKTIGVFISHVNGDYQDVLSRGIIAKALELDYNVAFFTNFGGYGQQEYDHGEFFITELPNYEELDGIIIAPDIMRMKNLEAQYRYHIKNRSNCPVVSVRRETEGFYNVLVDDDLVLNDIISHFIEIHGFTRINFLAGPEGAPTSTKRLKAYKRILAEHNLPVEDDRIFYGDFWKHSGFEAIDRWCSSSQEMPQAIVCANDYMAFTVCKALAGHGIEVPDQIAVTGCDDINDASEFRPSLTTAKIPFYEMGMEAVVKIDKHYKGIEQPQNMYLDTTTIYRASCGCKRHWYQSNERRRNHVIEREAFIDEITRNAYMSADLTGVTKLEDVTSKLWHYIYQNENVSRFCMCLYEDWDYYHNTGEERHITDRNNLVMEAGIRGMERYTKVKYSKKELIPSVLADDKPVFYYFAMLHHQGHCFGYVGISFSKIQTYMQAFQAWLIHLSNALENIRIHGELNRLVFRLEDMSIRDELTELYNRRVIDTLGKNYLNQCVEEHTKLMIFTADMDKLKYINDKFGHSQGDIALKVISSALQYAADDDEICIRLGGDEFMAIGIDYDEGKISKFINRFIDELNKFNLINLDQFGVFVSYGYYLVLPDAGTTIEECLIEADASMYRQKYEKEAKRIKANLVC